MRLSALIGSIGLMLLMLAAEALAATDIHGVRIWRAPDNTRLVFDLKGPVQHNLFTLVAPDRIVIDISNASLSTSLGGLDLKNTPISGIRSAQRDVSDLRVVIDLTAPVNPKSFTLPPNQQYGHRLVVDLYDQNTPPAASIPEQVAGQQIPVPVSPTQRPPKAVTPASAKRDIIVAIDAGHGGEDPGALSPVKGQYEKHVTLAIAKELQKQINAQKGFRGELVRTGDYFIPLRKRTEIARKKGADLFISIHADAAPRASASGASVYALSEGGATSETARWLADSENQSDLIGGTGSVTLDDKDRMLAGVLLDLSMTATLTSSLNVGKKVLDNMGGVTKLHKTRVEQAGFMVLKSPDIPSILVETGFITNPQEASKLRSSSHQRALAVSINKGVVQFFKENPPPGTYIAWQREEGKISIGPRKHVVSRGESLSMIALRYEISMAQLKSANNLKSDTLKVGQTLTIPATSMQARND